MIYNSKLQYFTNRHPVIIWKVIELIIIISINDVLTAVLQSSCLLPLCFPLCRSLSGEVEPELLHTYSRIDPYDTLILCVRVAVLTAVTLTVPIVLFPVSTILAH